MFSTGVAVLFVAVSSLLICLFQTQISLVRSHVVLTKDEHGGSKLIISGESEGGKKEEGNNDNLVIANHGQGENGEDSNFVMQDPKEGDVVIDGSNIVIPGDDGHIVLAGPKKHNHQNNNHYYRQSYFGGASPFMSLFNQWMMPRYKLVDYYKR